MNMGIFGGEERVEAGNDRASTNRPSKVRLLILILVLLIFIPIILSIFLYYLPLNDVEVTVDKTYRITEWGGSEHSLIGFSVNVTNIGSISHYFYLTGKVVFSTEPDMVFTETSRSNPPIDPGEMWSRVHIYVPVPDELLQDSYDASCSVTLPSFADYIGHNAGWMVPAIIVWLVLIAAISTSLLRSRRKNR